jgi:four helix bundle protein
MHEFRKLRVYKRGLELTRIVRKVTMNFPIAEGAGRKTARDFSRFLDNALGSANECRACLDIALEIGFVDESEHLEIDSAYDDLIAMIVGLQRSML